VYSSSGLRAAPDPASAGDSGWLLEPDPPVQPSGCSTRAAQAVGGEKACRNLILHGGGHVGPFTSSSVRLIAIRRVVAARGGQTHHAAQPDWTDAPGWCQWGREGGRYRLRLGERRARGGREASGGRRRRRPAREGREWGDALAGWGDRRGESDVASSDS
jgi:hypothetical protein